MRKQTLSALAFVLLSTPALAQEHNEAAPAAYGEGHGGAGAPTEAEAHHFCEHEAAQPELNLFSLGYKHHNEEQLHKCVEWAVANTTVHGDGAHREIEHKFLEEAGKAGVRPVLWGPPFAAALLNFAILAFLLVRLAKKPLSDMLGKRHDDIKKGLEESRKRFEEAQSRLAEYEQKLKSMEETRRSIEAQYEEQAKREVERTRQEAEKQIAKIRSDAEREIQTAIVYAEKALRREAAEAAISAAESILAREIGADDRRRLTEQFISKVSSSKQLGGAA